MTGKQPTPPADLVAEAVARELAAIAKVDEDLAQSGLAAVAQVLARELDDAETPATAKAACSRALAEALAQLRDQLPQGEEKDKVHDLGARRAARLARRAKA